MGCLAGPPRPLVAPPLEFTNILNVTVCTEIKEKGVEIPIKHLIFYGLFTTQSCITKLALKGSQRKRWLPLGTIPIELRCLVSILSSNENWDFLLYNFSPRQNKFHIEPNYHAFDQSLAESSQICSRE